jgi:hypothetical protein
MRSKKYLATKMLCLQAGCKQDILLDDWLNIRCFYPIVLVRYVASGYIFRALLIPEFAARRFTAIIEVSYIAASTVPLWLGC